MALDVTPDSLVLLDEIGSATDPEEGGALGVALVDHFRAAGAFTLASTHLTALKIYGANTKTVLNASMGFDEETLEPTYQLAGRAAGQIGGPRYRGAARHAGGHSCKRARASLSTQEIELSRTDRESAQAAGRDGPCCERTLERERAALVAREKQIAQECGAQGSREAARNWKPASTKCSGAGRSARTRPSRGSRRRPRSAKRSIRRSGRLRECKREMREDWETNLANRRRAAARSRSSKIEEGTRVRLKGIREPARVRRVLGRWPV